MRAKQSTIEGDGRKKGHWRRTERVGCRCLCCCCQQPKGELHWGCGARACRPGFQRVAGRGFDVNDAGEIFAEACLSMTTSTEADLHVVA